MSVWVHCALLVATAGGIVGRTAAQETVRPPQVTTVATSEPIVSRGRLGGVAIDGDGNLFVSNFGASVWRVTPQGSATVVVRGLRGSSGNTVDRQGNLYQASFLDGRIVRVTPNGRLSELVSGGLQGPVGLTVTDDGSVYVCECRRNAVARVAPDGGVSVYARHPDLDCPNGITSGPDGALYVVSFNNGHVVRIDPAGHASRFATIPQGRNAHVAYARGAFWVTKIETNLLYRLSGDGQVERYAGTGSIGFADGPVRQAPLARPNGIAVTPRGDALVVNTLEGPWRGDEETHVILRRVDLPPRDGDPERIAIPVGELVFDALAAGPPDGELVLLLHGFPQTSHAFIAQLRALGNAGYRAVAPDQRGYSPGARPPDREQYVMRNFVADAVGMVDALGYQRFHLVGHDWGGAVAWVTATRYPNRVRTLTVLSTPHFAALSAVREESTSDQAERSSYFAQFAEPDAAERFLADDMAVFRQVLAGVPEQHQEVYLARLGTPEAMRAALAWYHVFARRAGPSSGGGRPTGAQAVTPVRVPTLYAWGSEDGAFGRAAAVKTAEFVAGPYEFHVLDGVGHWVPEIAADEVNRLLLRHLRTTGLETLDNYRDARRAVGRAVEALGGTPAVLGFETLSARYRAGGIARGQSRRPGPPFDSTGASGQFVYDTDGRLYHEETFVNEGGTDRSFRRALRDEGSWNLWVARGLLSAIAPSDVEFLRARPQLNPAKAFPHSLLQAALRNVASLRYLGETVSGGRGLVRISFAEPDGAVTTLAIDTATGLPALAERLGSDQLTGDAVYGVRFEDYAPVGDLRVPRAVAFTLNGDPTLTWALSDIAVNATVDTMRFTPPDNLTFVNHPPRFRPSQVAPGVHVVRLYSGPANSYNTMLVEFSDHVVVVEAPLVGAFYPAIRQVANAVAPGKPIRSVVTTHHHHDHAGGAARFLAAGIDVIAPPHAIAVIRAMTEARHSIAPAQPGGNEPGRLIAVRDSLVLSDGVRALRLLQVGPTPHVDQILVAHLPAERVLYVADLFAVPESRVFPPPSATFTHFAALVTQFDLGFDHIVPTHGLVGDPADLQAATGT